MAKLSDIQVELRPHPAQARHPITNEPLFHDDGSPVPLIEDQLSIWVDGRMVGYTNQARTRAMFITPPSALPWAVRNYVEGRIENLLGSLEGSEQVPDRTDEEDADEDE